MAKLRVKYTQLFAFYQTMHLIAGIALTNKSMVHIKSNWGSNAQILGIFFFMNHVIYIKNSYHILGNNKKSNAQCKYIYIFFNYAFQMHFKTRKVNTVIQGKLCTDTFYW